MFDRLKVYEKLYEELLLEMPKRIKPIDNLVQHLINRNANKRSYDLLVNNDKSKFLLDYKGNKNLPIVEIMVSDCPWIYGLNTQTKTINYFAQLEEQNINFLNKKWITQTLLWSSNNNEFKGISQWMIFNYILPTYKTIMTDSRQSYFGERFWLNLIEESFHKGLNIYFVDFNTSDIYKIQNQKEFDDIYDSEFCPWGDEENHEKYRIAISLEEFN